MVTAATPQVAAAVMSVDWGRILGRRNLKGPDAAADPIAIIVSLDRAKMQTLDGILFCFFPGISRSKERERKENGEFLQSTPYVLLIFIIQTLHVNPSKSSNLYFHPFFKPFFLLYPVKMYFKKI